MSSSLSQAERKLIAPYVTNLERPVFALQNLPEEVVAVLFAYYSRSTDGLRTNLAKLLQEKDLEVVPAAPELVDEDGLVLARDRARAFHEKWVLGYGHGSVAEHGVVHLALEDVSILTSKIVEDARLASYTEKSTRYVQFDKNRYLKPRAIMQSRHAQQYVQAADALFDAYASMRDPLETGLRRLHPPKEGQRKRAYAAAICAKGFDVLRYLLPAATFTNIGVTLNGRVAEHLISRLLSEPLEEVRLLGNAIKTEAQQVLPTLVKYAAYNPYRARSRDALEALADDFFSTEEPSPASSVQLVRYDPDAELELIASILYPQTRLPLHQLRRHISTFSQEACARVIRASLFNRGPHDAPIRALEHITYSVDMLVDFGAYRDIQRHRMASQATQPLTVAHGFEVPEELEILDLVEPFEILMEKAAECYSAMAGSLLNEASYIVPLAYRRRVSFTWNLREIFHFVELRSAPQGHRSYRRVAQELFRQIARVHPFIAEYIRVHLDDPGLERLQAEEQLEASRERRGI